MEAKIKKTGTFEAALYIGSKQGYHGSSFTKDELIEEINYFQDHHEFAMPVRITDCIYTKGSNYREDGWEVSAVLYPNFPQPIPKINDFIEQLAEHLLWHFKQNRITIRRTASDEDTTMFERPNAEKTHKKKILGD